MAGSRVPEGQTCNGDEESHLETHCTLVLVRGVHSTVGVYNFVQNAFYARIVVVMLEMQQRQSGSGITHDSGNETEGGVKEKDRDVRNMKKKKKRTVSSLRGLDWDLDLIFPTPPLPEEKNSPSRWGL